MYKQISQSSDDMDILQHQCFRFLCQTENSTIVFLSLLRQILSPSNWEAALSWYKNRKKFYVWRLSKSLSKLNSDYMFSATLQWLWSVYSDIQICISVLQASCSSHRDCLSYPSDNYKLGVNPLKLRWCKSGDLQYVQLCLASTYVVQWVYGELFLHSEA